MKEHEEFNQEISQILGDLSLELATQRDSEDGQEDCGIPLEGAGGGGLAGIEIIWADQTSTFIRGADMMEDYDPDPDGEGHLYWSLVLDVGANRLFDSEPTSGFAYDASEDLFEDDGGTYPRQTKYRFRIITQGVDSEGDPVNVPISLYGQYREATIVISGAPFQTLIKTT